MSAISRLALRTIPNSGFSKAFQFYRIGHNPIAQFTPLRTFYHSKVLFNESQSKFKEQEHKSKPKFEESEHNSESKPKKSSGGMKDLIKKYGYASLGIYLFLSAVDLPLCYLLVASLGEDKINEYKEKVKAFFGFGKKDSDNTDLEQDVTIDTKPVDENSWTAKYGNFLTIFAIAYGIHKSLAIVRLPVTASITPFVVKKLQKYGFNIGKTSTKQAYKVTKDSIKEHGFRKSVLNKANLKKNMEIANNKTVDYSNVDPSLGIRTKGKKRWWNFFL